MKKILTCALAALLLLPTFAREKEPVASSADGKVTFDVASHVGYGYHFVKSSDFRPAWSGNLFINLVKLGVHLDDLSLGLGLDFDYKNFTSKESIFLQDGAHKIQTSAFPTMDGTLKKCRGGIDVFSLTTPLHVQYSIGHIRLGLGAEANFNLTGDTYFRYKVDNKRTLVSESKAAVNPFSYGFFATLGVNDGCFFFKYYPKSSRILPKGSVDLGFMTLGIAFGL